MIDTRLMALILFLQDTDMKDDDENKNTKSCLVNIVYIVDKQNISNTSAYLKNDFQKKKFNM